jgi:RNA polymerase sigma-70 factor (ECF subfamily)
MENEQVFELLQRMAEKDERALREIYGVFSRKVYAFALNRLRNPAQAEEIVVDTMHEVWKHPGRFRGESRFSTWLLGIARYKILSALRARDPEHEDIDDMNETLPSSDPDAFAQLAEQQRREGVRLCMDKLPEEQRECLHLVYYEGASLTEVASVQECPENTVKTRLFNARQKIKNCLRLLLEKEA